MSKRNLKYIAGLSLIEILIGIIITSIMMAAMYTSYTVVNQSYSQVSEKAKISRSSRDLVSMLMRDIRMSGFRYYAGSFEINKYADDTRDDCTAPGMTLPKLSYLVFQDGFNQGSGVEYTDDENHSPIVIRKNTLGPNRTSETRGVSEVTNDTDLCCDQIQIVYEDFNQNDILQPYKKYRITYFGSQTGTDEVVTPNGIKNINRYGVYKLIQSWSQVRTSSTDCVFPITGSWVTNCPECTSEPVLVRDHIEDMEFIPFDGNGRIIKDSSGDYPAPEKSVIRDRLYDIRGVDIKLIFRSKDNFFTRSGNRALTGLSSRNQTYEDRYLRDVVVVSVHTRNIGGESFQ
jgi:hypothetical protein